MLHLLNSTYEVRKIKTILRAVAVITVLLSASGLHGRMLVEPGVDAVFADIRTLDGKGNPRASGELMEGWMDDSSWADVTVAYSGEEEGGIKFQRVRVTEWTNGQCQLVHDLPGLSGGDCLLLKFKARSPGRIRLEFGIRMKGAPWDFYWKGTEAPGEEWSDYEYFISMKEEDKDAGLFFYVAPEGVLDIRDISLMKTTRRDMEKHIRDRNPVKPGINLMRLSRFPLGAQNGWSISRDADTEIVPDDSCAGPSGYTAVKVTAPEKTAVFTNSFKVYDPFTEHTASFYVRGTGALRAVLMADSDTEITSTECGFLSTTERSTDWRRIELRFRPDMEWKDYYIVLEMAGVMWFDAFKAEQGSKATDYNTRFPCEVALAVDSPIRVIFEDESPVFKYCVTGAPPEGSKLRVKVINAYGDEKYLPDIPLEREAVGKMYRGELGFDVFPGRKLGPFRIEAWVEDEKGGRVSTYNELAVNRLRKPHYWMKDAPLSSPFGVHVNPTIRHLKMAKAMGLNWVRLHDAGQPLIGWYYLERQKGLWTFYDGLIQRYRDHGLRILGLLNTSPEWGSTIKKKHNAYFDRFYPPKDWDAYANYVRTVVARYKGIIDYYEIWNEPWINGWMPAGYDEEKGKYFSGPEPWADYTKLMKVSYENAKKVHPGVKILGINSTTNDMHYCRHGIIRYKGGEWAQKMIEQGAINYCDIVSYHDYQHGSLAFPGDGVDKGYERGVEPMAREYGDSMKDVWLSEGSPLNNTGSGFYNHTFVSKDTEDFNDTADRICRFVVSILAQGNKKLFLYSMHCHRYVGYYYNNLLTPEGYLHPLGSALNNLTWLLEGKRYMETLELGEGVYAFIFSDGRHSAAMLSNPGGKGEYDMPSSGKLALADLYGNPVEPGVKLGGSCAWISGRMNAGKLKTLLK